MPTPVKHDLSVKRSRGKSGDFGCEYGRELNFLHITHSHKTCLI